jgi:hypothetical protein
MPGQSSLSEALGPAAIAGERNAPANMVSETIDTSCFFIAPSASTVSETGPVAFDNLGCGDGAGFARG